MNYQIIKTKLLVTIGAFLLCISFNSNASTISHIEYTCPLGGEKFSVVTQMSYYQSGMRLDLKPEGAFYSVPEPIPVCPNGFVIYQQDYSDDELKRLKIFILSDQYQLLRKGNSDYFLLATILEFMGYHKDTVGYTFLEASWEVEGDSSAFLGQEKYDKDGGGVISESLTPKTLYALAQEKLNSISTAHFNREKYIQYLDLAIENFEAVLSLEDSNGDMFTVYFLLVELNRLKGSFEVASKHIKALESHVTTTEYQKELVEFEKRLIKNNNSTPKNLP